MLMITVPSARAPLLKRTMRDLVERAHAAQYT